MQLLNQSIKFYLSTRADGTMQFVGGAEALKNRRTYLEKIGIGEERVVAAKLVGGNHIAVVTESDAGQALEATDGLITTTQDLYLSITVADCIPVVIYSPGQVIALLHAGWRGLDSQIIPEAVASIAQLGFDPSSLFAYLGPHICPTHYGVPMEVAAHFSAYPSAILSEGNNNYLDLSLIAQEQLLTSGITRENIVIDETCTYETKTLFSARRDQTTPTQAMLVLAAL